jgi:hypothetical protein
MRRIITVPVGHLIMVTYDAAKLTFRILDQMMQFSLQPSMLITLFMKRHTVGYTPGDFDILARLDYNTNGFVILNRTGF